MNIIGPIFAFIAVLVLLYFGMGIVQTMMDNADESIEDGTELSDSLNTSVELTAPAFGIMGMSVWVLVLIVVIGGLYLLMKCL